MTRISITRLGWAGLAALALMGAPGEVLPQEGCFRCIMDIIGNTHQDVVPAGMCFGTPPGPHTAEGSAGDLLHSRVVRRRRGANERGLRKPEAGRGERRRATPASHRRSEQASPSERVSARNSDLLQQSARGGGESATAVPSRQPVRERCGANGR
jgi:hypothetical protein